MNLNTSETSGSSDLIGIKNVAHFYQLSYSSVLSKNLSVAELDGLASHAQHWNQQSGITGMLMVEQGLVIQWLEGDRQEVRALWAKLVQDKRHHCIVKLIEKNFATERLFPDWSMQRVTHQEMVDIVQEARHQAENGVDTPWADAISTLCLLIDPAYAKAHLQELSDKQSALPVNAAAGQGHHA